MAIPTARERKYEDCRDGGAGFLGSRLIARLLDQGFGPDRQVVSVVSLDRVECPVRDARVTSVVGSIDDAADVARALSQGPDVVYHLAAVLSGQSEAEFDTGLNINVDATRLLLEECRKLAVAPRFVFTSSLAVFGGEMPDTVPETMATMPQSSYGCGKAIGELLVGEYSRKGFVDGITCRLPTISVRPGKPNSAASSFVSGILREPLAGEPSECPVPLDTRLWISSPDAAIANLVLAGGIAGRPAGPEPRAEPAGDHRDARADAGQPGTPWRRGCARAGVADIRQPRDRHRVQLARCLRRGASAVARLRGGR